MFFPVESPEGSAPVVVRVPGPDLDLAVADMLRSELGAAAMRGPATLVVVDLSAVSFVDCAGLGPLVGAQDRFGPRLLLRGAGPQVCRLLELTGLLGLFQLEESGGPAARAHFS